MRGIALALLALACALTPCRADDLAAIIARIDARAAEINAAAPVPMGDGRAKVVSARRVDRKLVMQMAVDNPSWQWKWTDGFRRAFTKDFCPQVNQDEFDAGFQFQVDIWDDHNHFINSFVIRKDDCRH